MTTLTKMMIGFTAGAILGILYAPAKGSKTRTRLSYAGGNIRDGWNSLTDGIAAALDSDADNIEEYAEVMVSEIEEGNEKNPHQLFD